MRNWKLFGKIGAIALTALGLALVPGDFNVPGVGTVEAFADVTALTSSNTTITVGEAEYNADAVDGVKPTVTVIYNSSTTLEENVHYTVGYSDNKKAGTGKVTITGKTEGGYSGTVTRTFTIKKAKMSNVTTANFVTGSINFDPLRTTALNDSDVNDVIDTSVLKLGEKALQPEDYVVAVKAGDTKYEAGIHTLVLKPGTNGNLEGTVELEYNINPVTIVADNITINGTPFTFTGEQIKPSVTVATNTTSTGATKKLTEGKDYTVEYGNNISAENDGTVTVTPIGNYTTADGNALTKNFEIAPIPFAKVSVEFDPASGTMTYNGEDQALPSVSVVVKDTGVVIDPDLYEVPAWKKDATDATFIDDAGEYTVTIDAGANFSEDLTGKYVVNSLDIADATVTGINDQYYKGTAYTWADFANAKVTFEGEELTEGEDYTVAIKNGAAVGKATITLTGIGNFANTTKTINFNIKRGSFENATVELEKDEFTYDGSIQKAAIKSVKLEEEGYDPVEFAAGDYKLVYAPANPKDAGDVTVTITPKDTTKYTGTSKKSYTIKKASFEAIDAGINEISNVEYTGKDIEPEVTVGAIGYDVKEDEYTVAYSDNKNVGTATVVVTAKADGNFEGSISGSFKITAADWGTPTVADIEDQNYNGGEVTPEVEVTLADKTKLSADDYEVTYKNNSAIGTATVTISPTGNYTGNSIKKEFKIVAADLSSEKVATITAKAQTYTGKELTPVVVTQTLSDGTKKTLTAGKDYTVVYEDNTGAGTAKYTVTGIETAGYTGTKSGEFTINKAVTKAKITKLASKNGKKTVAPKKKLQLVATQTPTKADANHTLKNTITWTSSNKKIATVNKNGKITGVKAGVATITAKSADGTKKTFKVTVVGVTSKTTQSVKAGKSVKIKANDTIKKATATSGKAYVKVSKSGKTVTIKGVKAGKAKVTITTTNGGKDVVTVTVK